MTVAVGAAALGLRPPRRLPLLLLTPLLLLQLLPPPPLPPPCEATTAPRLAPEIAALCYIMVSSLPALEP